MRKPIGQVVETDIAQPLTPMKTVRIGQAVEVDTAQPLRVIVVPVGAAAAALVYALVRPPHPHLPSEDPIVLATDFGVIVVALVVAGRMVIRSGPSGLSPL